MTPLAALAPPRRPHEIPRQMTERTVSKTESVEQEALDQLCGLAQLATSDDVRPEATTLLAALYMISARQRALRLLAAPWLGVK